MRTKTSATIESLHIRFKYDPETGTLVRKFIKGSSCNWKDRPTGKANKHGHLVVRFKDQYYLVHRICWAIYHGKWPSGVVDHINGIPDDNRISNLRDITNSEN